MVGLQLLKHTSNLSEDEVVALWVDNPYWQHFCGEPYFRHDSSIDPSLMTGFLKRVGESGCKFILGLTVQAGLATKKVARTALAAVNVVTTVQDRPWLLRLRIRTGHKPFFTIKALQLNGLQKRAMDASWAASTPAFKYCSAVIENWRV
jgi:transposase, IS5 family